MKSEVDSAAGFLVNILRLNERSRDVHPQLLDSFRSRLTECLRNYYTNHWFPESPFRGSGYRCIRINGRLDPVISLAGKSCGLPDSFLYSLFPAELTLWVDPHEVSYRIGENGSVCVLYSAEKLPSTPSKSEPIAEVSVSSKSPRNLSPPRSYQQQYQAPLDGCGKDARRKLVFSHDAQNICRVETN